MARNPRSLLGEGSERGVSPVIGVILLIAVTVVLGAVVASLALDFGGSSGAAPPNAQFTFDSANGEVIHDGGETVVDGDFGSYKLQGAGGISGDNVNTSNIPATTGDSLMTGVSGYSNGETIELVWESPDGEQTEVVAEFIATQDA